MQFLFLRCAWLMLLFAPLLAQTAQPEVSNDPPEELIVQISVNGIQQRDDAQVILREKNNTLLFSAEGLRSIRVRLPSKPDLVLDGVDYYRLTSVQGFTWTLDEATLALALNIPAEAFDASAYSSQEVQKNTATIPTWSGLLNYDLLGQHSGGQTQEAGSFELGVSGPLGVGNTGVLMRRSQEGNSTLRLESTWTYDRPAHIATLTLGDSISRSGSGWGQSVRFGGIQYATNFATQPGMVLLPQQSISGSAVVPSTVDVFINNSLVSRQPVPAGPFSIKDIPIMAGPGQMQVIVRDPLGREQIMTTSFFGSSYLIRTGLNDYSFEAGAMRNNFGTQSNDYGDHFASGTWRRGFTPWFTGEVHGEFAQGGNHAIGVGAALPIAKYGVMNITAATSSSERGRGALVGIGFVQQAGSTGISVNVQGTNAAFWRLGQTATQSAPKLVANASLGISLPYSASLGLGYFRQDYREVNQPAIRLATAGLTFQLPRSIFAGLNATQSLSGDKDLSAGLFISIPMGPQGNTSISAQRTQTAYGSTVTGTASMQRSLPIGQGLGYQVQVQQDGNLQASGTYQNNIGTYTAQLNAQQGEVASQLSAQGSILTTGGGFFASRTNNDSFALVHVPGFAKVRVYNSNQLAGMTDAKGYAIVPRLMAYQPNKLRIEEQDLPLDAQVAQLEQVAVPWYRSGVKIQFPVTRHLSTEMHVIDDQGQPILAGATARIEGSAEEFVVADNGRLYLSGITEHNRVFIQADERRCLLEFSFKPSADPLQDLGTLICKGVNP